uniref:heterogeneous nuclear ribonucleoprotein 1-like n=1 Tax=Erigeron canadensis TaxID=72917 RepID=UPI001CB907CA|nr:heterogeneous nuclear ribonucleoprotein 1-like [Erigeron canadensis]XP_043636281.1 heterogeneous nuclear ribonucleoprotein 1-like [Erigeron canadensis]
MDSDEGKLFLGGIAWETTEERLNDYFTKYGVVSQTVIMRDKITGRPRGFGFVVFADPSVLDSVLQDRHTIDGRNVEAKRALSREEQQASKPANNAGRNSGGTGNYRTKKIFVGGLPSTLTEEQFRQYFESYGDVTDVVIMFDQNTNRPRGFGFISFDTEDAVDRVIQKTFHELNNKLVEVKRALPKDANPGGGGGGGGGRGGGYQGHNAGSFDSQMDGNRFTQQQNSGGGYPAYSGYGQPSYGYGAPNGNTGYGSYGAAGYGAPAGGYGNPNAGSNPGALKSPWGGGQTPGYGGAGYGANTGYGGAGYGANTGYGGAGYGAPVGQSPSGGSSYGNQGYGYGNYGTNEGYNTNTAGYGAAAGGRPGPGVAANSMVGSGVDQQGPSGGGYMGGPYNGQPGYSNAAWRSDT